MRPDLNNPDLDGIAEPPSINPGVRPEFAVEGTLDRLGATGSAVVVSIAGDDALARRLAASGLWAGVRVERIGRAPFGDPLLFRLHGYRLALRRCEAARVYVELAENVEGSR